MIKLDYAGDTDPKETWKILEKDKNSVLIDCRSSAEWQFVGIPNLELIGKKTYLIEWQIYPSMSVNENFINEITDSGINKDQTIVLLCRSGGRSKSAAEFLTSYGFKNCYNCIYGFEGSHDHTGHRGTNNGWKHSMLPWKQS